jgi:glycosyltransferase involved in cell wall biosynthesis
MAEPAISVVIPVYNGARYLVASIESALAQTVEPAEVIVVDDGSTDASSKIARAFGPPVRVLTQPNLGPAAARNLGVEHAGGDLLAFLDADDLWMPDKLARQQQALQADAVCEAVLGRAENFISPELDETQRALLARSATQTGHMLASTLLIRHTAFLRVGSFDVRWRHGDFIAWWAHATRLALHYTILPDLVLRRRLHIDNMTRREPLGRADYVRLLRADLAQRRAAETRSRGATPDAP